MMMGSSSGLASGAGPSESDVQIIGWAKACCIFERDHPEADNPDFFIFKPSQKLFLIYYSLL
jgi:hypothetical protein